ncbi:hypothetical protein [Microbacterium thalassium]|uniref:Thioredoxin-like fold domain-containing protein n=1 Tax=Microbacterium thalassium TaxID=362649 RepID=A0A7X0FQ33_9MICO|nr:hypothetical protein [Microbacterium thalassium]MBB6391603.1 hypothetical protein [Microbacterium thalassium]GLK24206.1 hypothetical protein GCM10017607_15240 [Microbacterium thalassium]
MAKHRVDRALVKGMTKRERQAFVREARRAERERLARLKRRRRIAGWSSGAAAVVAIGAVVAVSAVGSAQAAAAAAAAGPANMITDGLLVESSGDGSTTSVVTTAALAADETPSTNLSTVATTGVLDVQVYLDMTDADAAAFWTANGAALESAAAAGGLTLELHPVALDTADARDVAAVAAFACIGDQNPDSAPAFWDAVLAAESADEGTVYTTQKLATLASGVGVTDGDTTSCIADGGFTDWATSASSRAAASVPYTSDPVDVSAGPVLVAAGTAYTGALDDVDALLAFLSDVYTEATADATG